MVDKTTTQEDLATDVADIDLVRFTKGGLSKKATFALVKSWIKTWVAEAGANIYDTRAAVAASYIPAVITSIQVQRFATNYPIQPAPYERGTVGSAMAIADAGGNYWGINSTEVYPDWFGARRGAGIDDGPALRTTMLYLKNKGTACIMRLGLGEYLISTLSASVGIFLYTNVSIIGSGENSIIKFGNNVSVSSYIGLCPTSDTAGSRVDGAMYKDFTVDGNGINNATAAYKAGFFIWYGYNITFDGVTVKNWPGSQPLALGKSAGLTGEPASPTIIAPVVRNCKITDCGYVSNALVTDSSGIYVVATAAVIEDNVIVNANIDIYGTGVELHGTGICSNNAIYHVRKGFNVGGYPATDFLVSGNRVEECYEFFTYWETIGGGQPSFVTKARFVGNIVTQLDASKNALINVADTSTTVAGSILEVTDNTLTSFEAAGAATIFPVLRYGKIAYMRFANNTVSNFSGQFVAGVVEPLTNTQTLIIENNTIIDCCKTANASYKRAIEFTVANTMLMLVIRDNTFENIASAYMTTGIYCSTPMKAANGKAIIEGNVFYNVATAYNWTGTGRVEGIWLAYTPVVTSSGGVPTTTTPVGKYKVSKDELVVIVGVTIVNKGTATSAMNVTTPTGYVITNESPFFGKELVLTNKSVGGYAAVGSSLLSQITFYDGTTVWVDTHRVVFQATMQINPN